MITWWDAFLLFKQGVKVNGKPLRSDRCAALLGYGRIVKEYGWDVLSKQLSGRAVWQVQRDYKLAGIQPEDVDFSDINALALAGHMDDEGRQTVLAFLRRETGDAGDDR